MSDETLAVLGWLAGLAAGLALLVKSADTFIGTAEKVGRSMGLSRFIVGVTIVAFGTSAPELVASVAATLMGQAGVAAGTVVGSNVANLLLILSVAAIVGGGIQVEYELLRVDLPFLFGSALLLTLCAASGSMGFVEGLLCLAALGVYIAYAARSADTAGTLGLLAGEVPAERPGLSPRLWFVLLASLGFLQLGAWGTVESVSRLSDALGFGREVLAASVVAVGTSLPELVVSVRAAQGGNPEVAVGNVIGSNIFNALGVTGAAALFGTVTFPGTVGTFGLGAMLAVTILCIFVTQDREMTPWDGWLLLVGFAGFNLHLYGVI